MSENWRNEDHEERWLREQRDTQDLQPEQVANAGEIIKLFATLPPSAQQPLVAGLVLMTDMTPEELIACVDQAALALNKRNGNDN